MNDLVKLNFQGDDVLLVDVDGKPYVVLKPALEGIGLDAKSQMDKLKKRSWARTGAAPVRDSAGRMQPTTVCDVRTFLMLLATIDENLVSDKVRPKLIAYQDEVADAIEAYWTGTYNLQKNYIRNSPAKWEKMFDNWLKVESTRLGIPYATLIRKYAYERFLPAGVIQEIDKKNPIVYFYPNGRRYRQHQFLSEIKGRPELRERLNAFQAIAQTCTSKAELDRFMATYDRNGGPPAITAR